MEDLKYTQNKFMEYYLNLSIDNQILIMNLVKQLQPETAPSVATEKNSESTWMSLDEVCKRYHLPKNNIKSRKWREENHFPFHQNGGAYCSVTYNSREIDEWMQNQKY